MENTPLVSVGIPNYNYSHYIIAALNSVINQTYQYIELIIIDDLSTDNSIDVIEDWIINYNGPVKINFIKNNKNGGLHRALKVSFVIMVTDLKLTSIHLSLFLEFPFQ